ncbi:hypothetical protein RYX36_030325, partial [Vicia faba]
RAAENILKLDPSNSDAMVMLSDIHASTGNWEDVAKLRNLIKQMGVQKVVKKLKICSWVGTTAFCNKKVDPSMSIDVSPFENLPVGKSMPYGL